MRTDWEWQRELYVKFMFYIMRQKTEVQHPASIPEFSLSHGLCSVFIVCEYSSLIQ